MTTLQQPAENLAWYARSAEDTAVQLQRQSKTPVKPSAEQEAGPAVQVST